MRVLLAILFVAAVAQANDVDWTNVYPMDVIPQDLAGVLDESLGEADLASRIVGGQEATPGQFPYQIGLLSTSAPGVGFCGGSILSEEWILTAAHCVDVAESAEVVVAAHYINNRNEEGQIIIPVSKIIVHANWNALTIKNDIALLQLSTPLEFSARIQPIRLPSRSQASTNFASVTGTVSGWGRDSDSAQAISPVLRWTSNPITTQSSCNLYFFGNIDGNQICLAGSGGRSSCNGDSGGPLVVTDSDGQVTQVGVVSFGIALGCARGWPGVYVRVTSYLDWIEAQTGGAVVIRN